MKLALHLKEIPKNARVVVGVSGGRDSMALVYALLQQRPDLELITAHINHQLRADANADEAFVLGMMQRWGVDCKIFRPRPPEDGNIEEWGRDKRYEFFEKLRKKNKADFIFTAHHQDDDFESMLLHVLRGTRVKGLSGMMLNRDNLYRPLLLTSREQINEYVDANEIPYRNDPTNDNNEYSRNFLRNKVIPVLSHVYPGLAERWQKQKAYWVELQEMMEEAAKIFTDEYLDPKEGLHRKSYGALPYPLRATILELWFQKSTGKRVPDNATLERWDHAIRTFTPRKKTEWYSGQPSLPSSSKAKFLVMTKERAKLG